MKKLKKKNRKLFRNERGQGMVEYILLLVVVIGLVMVFKNKIVEIVKGKAEEVGSAVGEFQVE